MKEANLYLDWQNLKKPLGKGSLIQKLGEGLPFILYEENEKRQTVYYCEQWLVEFPDGLRKKCCIRKKKRGRLEPIGESERTTSLEDSFIKVFGKSIF